MLLVNLIEYGGDEGPIAACQEVRYSEVPGLCCMTCTNAKAFIKDQDTIVVNALEELKQDIPEWCIA